MQFFNEKKSGLVRWTKLQNLAFDCCQFNQQIIGGSKNSDETDFAAARS